MKKVFRTIILLFIGLYFFIHFFSSLDETLPSAHELIVDDFDSSDTLDNEIIVTHSRVWKDAADSVIQLKFSIGSSDAEAAYNFRETVEVEEDGTEKTFWNNLYRGLYDHDKGLMLSLQDSIRSLAAERSIELQDLPYTVVSMVQDIPYNYILSDDSCTFHTSAPCVPLQRYGVLSPVEFLYSLSGDCDTRTVLLFTLLKDLGYDPIIVNSSEYHHSMLAVDIPTEGDYFIHKGRKFYFWETTATGWLPGMLPPDMSNKDYWTIILDYELQADPSRSY